MGRKAQTMNVETAAKIIGKSPQYIRMGLQQQRLSFGSAVQKSTGHWSYNIISSKLYEYAGIKQETKDEN